MDLVHLVPHGTDPKDDPRENAERPTRGRAGRPSTSSGTPRALRNPKGAQERRGGSDEEVRALEIFGEVDLDRVEVGDVHRLEQHAVFGDRELETALEVVLVFDALQLTDERLLVRGRD